ncbi:MAG: hypothetical protein HXY28_13970 [Hydrogenophilaceae bacterium]|jgi:hypothetical protein|nr:hypothetical protein [Hydrogenophilaceae bacterium]
MSDLSLLSSVYANVEEFASLIDAVIQRVRQDGAAVPNADQTHLGQLLVDASDHGRSAQSYEALMFDSLLRTRTGEPLLDLEKLGRRLLAGPIDASDQRQLEILAAGLEQERTDVANRLRARR